MVVPPAPQTDKTNSLSIFDRCYDRKIDSWPWERSLPRRPSGIMNDKMSFFLSSFLNSSVKAFFCGAVAFHRKSIRQQFFLKLVFSRFWASHVLLVRHAAMAILNSTWNLAYLLEHLS